MRGQTDGSYFTRCNLCTVDITDDSYCETCKQSCYDRCSQAVDEIGMEFDLDLTYQMMAKVLQDRGVW